MSEPRRRRLWLLGVVVILLVLAMVVGWRTLGSGEDGRTVYNSFSYVRSLHGKELALTYMYGPCDKDPKAKVVVQSV